MNRGRPNGPRGFTIVEVIVSMVLTGLVVAGTLRALTAQKRFYARQARILDARHAMRATTTILASELREVSSQGGDLYGMASDSIAFRSTTGFAVTCAVDDGGGSLSLLYPSGYFVRQDQYDTAMVFVENSERDDDDSWRALPVGGISSSPPSCESGDAAERGLTTTPGSLSGIRVGAAVRLVRPYVYKLYEGPEGRWWLGRRLRPEAEFVPVAGPLAPPGDQGLVLTYYDPDGNATANPASVARVRIRVRAPTDKTLSDPAYIDLATSTFLRNSD